MQLNTKAILSGTCEHVNTTGITFHRRDGFNSEDITTNRSLYGYELDRNFYNLKAEDIKSARWDEERYAIVLERWGRDDFEVVIPFQDILETLQTMVDSHENRLNENDKKVSDIDREVKLIDGTIGAYFGVSGGTGDAGLLTGIVKDTIVSEEVLKSNDSIKPVISGTTVEFKLGAIVATMEDENED